ncbi:MAG: hypothetical protein HY744_23240 [Deltaproteobacteria bacterium]|nr:hypothetical protein [Deltaproteobacteria bacterium]
MAALSAVDALRLRAEIGNDLGQLARARDEVTSRAGATDQTTTYALALLLSNYYTGAEKLFKRMALPLGGLPPAGDRWHAQLLEDMTIELPGVRPAALAPATAEALADLLRFRHVVRNLYAWTVRRAEVDRLAAALPAAHEALEHDIGRFLLFVDALAADGQ